MTFFSFFPSFFSSFFFLIIILLDIKNHIGRKLKLCREENIHINVLVLAYNLNLENKKEEEGKRRITFGWNCLLLAIKST